MSRFFKSLCMSLPFFASSSLCAANEKLSSVEQLFKDKQIENKHPFKLTVFFFGENEYIGGYEDGLIVVWTIVTII